MSRAVIKSFVAGMVVACMAVAMLVMLLDYISCESTEAVGNEQRKIILSCGEKVIRFLLRHQDLVRITGEASKGETDPQRRMLNVLEWTKKNVRPVPPGFTIIDDHIPYIVLRGYGAEYQLAEVFTTLTTYAGYPGRWAWYTPPRGKRQVALSFVQSEDGWWVFDLRNGGWYETSDGKIATIADFRQPDRLIRRGQAPEALEGTPYLDYYRDLDKVFQNSFSRATGQMPWDRFWMELEKIFRKVI
jgi:hypothetical protein